MLQWLMDFKKIYIFFALFFLQSNTLANYLEIKFFKSDVVKKITQTTSISQRKWHVHHLLENKYLNLMAQSMLELDSNRERNFTSSFFSIPLARCVLEMINSTTNNIKNSIEALITICTCYPLGVSKQYFYFDDQQDGIEKLVLKNHCQELPNLKMLSPVTCVEEITIKEEKKSDARVIALIDKHLFDQKEKRCLMSKGKQMVGEVCVDKCNLWEELKYTSKKNTTTGKIEKTWSCEHYCSDEAINPNNILNLIAIDHLTQALKNIKLEHKEPHADLLDSIDFYYKRKVKQHDTISYCFVCPAGTSYSKQDNKCYDDETNCLYHKEELKDGKCVKKCEKGTVLKQKTGECEPFSCSDFLYNYYQMANRVARYENDKLKNEDHCLKNLATEKKYEKKYKIINDLLGKLSNQDAKDLLKFGHGYNGGDLEYNEFEAKFCKSNSQDLMNASGLFNSFVGQTYPSIFDTYCENNCEQLDDFNIGRMQKFLTAKCIPMRCKKCDNSNMIRQSYNDFKLKDKVFGKCTKVQIKSATEWIYSNMKLNSQNNMRYCKKNEINGDKVCEVPVGPFPESQLKELLASERFNCLSQ